MEDKIPPNNPMTERLVLSCIMRDPDKAAEMIADLSEGDFYDHWHLEVFKSCRRVQSDVNIADATTIQSDLKARLNGVFEKNGGFTELADIEDAAPSAAQFPVYLKTLHGLSNRRSVIRAARDAITSAYDEQSDMQATGKQFLELAGSIAERGKPKKDWIEFLSPSQCAAFKPDDDLMLVGDCHIVKGDIVVIGGAPGIGKSRVSNALAVAGATGSDWLGLSVHRRFKTLIIQNENGRRRLIKEFGNPPDELLNEYIRISPPPKYGMKFCNPDFRRYVAEQIKAFQPDVVILDPWNSVALDDTQKEYLQAFEQLQDVLPVENRPCLVIVAHTRKPKTDEKTTGRGLLKTIAGSHVLGSRPRVVFVMQAAFDDTEDDRVVWACCKNNDGAEGPHSAWYRRDGRFDICDDFDWDEWHSVDARKTGRSLKVAAADVVRVIPEKGGLSHSKLVEEVVSEMDVGSSAAKRAITKAKDEGLIYKDSQGFYCKSERPETGPKVVSNLSNPEEKPAETAKVRKVRNPRVMNLSDPKEKAAKNTKARKIRKPRVSNTVPVHLGIDKPAKL